MGSPNEIAEDELEQVSSLCTVSIVSEYSLGMDKINMNLYNKDCHINNLNEIDSRFTFYNFSSDKQC